MRALVWHGPGRISVDELPEPEAGAGEVLLVPEAAGICGSDVEGYSGAQGNRTPPLVMGHELAGRVVAVGEGVEAEWQGRRTAVNPLVPGDDARPGIEQLSRRRELIGVHRPGGFAGAVRVPASQLRELPAEVDARLGALAEPLANGVHANRIGRLGGAESVGVLELHDGRRRAARELGASATFSSADELRSATIGGSETFGEAEAPRSAAGDGFDLVFDAVGAEATRRLAIELLRPGGCAVMIGLATDATPVGFHAVVRGGLTIRGSYAYTADDYDAALALLVEGRAGLGELEAVRPLEAGPEAFAQLAARPSPRLKVFLAAEPA